MRLLNTFHCTPSSRPAWREASTKRTSSMTCCGDATDDRVDDLGRELARDGHRAVERDRVQRLARQHDAAVDRRHLDAGAGDPGDLGRQARHFVGHLDVEDADMAPVLGVDRHAGRADLLAEDRDRAIGQRRDVGNVRIADGDVGERRVDAQVLGLADRNQHGRGPLGAADLQHPLRAAASMANGDTSQADVTAATAASVVRSRRALDGACGSPIVVLPSTPHAAGRGLRHDAHDRCSS